MYVSLKLAYKIEFFYKTDSGNGLQARFRVGKGISGFSGEVDLGSKPGLA